jgi:hypothetical protein
MSAPSVRVMRLHFAADLYACGACGRPYRRGELYAGRGRHLDEHPEHEYAPCGHSQTWCGFRPLPSGGPHR